MFREFTFITQQWNLTHFTRSILSLQEFICYIACNCKYITHIIIIISLQLLILFARTLTYLEPKLFLLTVFYNNTLLIIKIVILFQMNVLVCILIFSRHLMAGMIALVKLLLSKWWKLSCFVFWFLHVFVLLLSLLVLTL
jgi:hypothetical protein